MSAGGKAMVRLTVVLFVILLVLTACAAALNPVVQRVKEVIPGQEEPANVPAAAPLSAPDVAISPPPDDIPADFTLPKLGGGEVTLSSYFGQAIFLNFWATWCPPCREEMPAMQRVYDRYRQDGLVILAINFQEDAETVQAFVDELGLTFPVLLDRNGEVTMLYQVIGLPTSYFINREGRIHRIRIGAMTEDFMVQTVEEILR